MCQSQLTGEIKIKTYLQMRNNNNNNNNNNNTKKNVYTIKICSMCKTA